MINLISSNKEIGSSFPNHGNQTDSLDSSSYQQKEDDFMKLKILADKQYDFDQKVFLAEGNAKALINGGILTADLMQYNRKSEVLIAEGSVIFKRGSQIFRAEKIIYNNSTKKGKIFNAYGILDFNHLNEDLNIFSSN